MREIILNNTFVSSDNSTYTYKFPLGSQPTFEKGDKIALDSLSMYYSWPNITAANGNNTFQYVWPTVGPVDVTIPDGFYTIADLNSYLQYVMIGYGHYLIDASGNNVYYLNFSTNSVRYAVQLDVSPLPATLGTYKYPTMPNESAWSLDNAAEMNPQVIIPSTNFGNIIGFNAGTYPSTGTAGTLSSTYSKISDFTPQVTPVSSVVVTCSLLNNKYSIPNNLLYSFAPNTTYGSQINITPPSKTFVDMQGGKVSEFSITFLDQTFKKLNILDNNVVILLTIASKDEL